MCEIDGEWEAAVPHREPSSVVCDDLEGLDAEDGSDGSIHGMGGRLKRQGIHVYI